MGLFSFLSAFKSGPAAPATIEAMSLQMAQPATSPVARSNSPAGHSASSVDPYQSKSREQAEGDAQEIVPNVSAMGGQVQNDLAEGVTLVRHQSPEQQMKSQEQGAVQAARAADSEAQAGAKALSDAKAEHSTYVRLHAPTEAIRAAAMTAPSSAAAKGIRK